MVESSSIDVVIVNWNSGGLLRRCLNSLDSIAQGEVYVKRVVVVDNASTDGSADGIDRSSLAAAVLRNTRNLGFAEACNIGARHSTAKYLLFLNPDVEIFRGSLSAPRDFLDKPENADVGICGIQLVDTEGRITRNSARFPRLRHFVCQALGLDRLAPSLFHGSLMQEWGHSETRDVDQVIGAFFFVRRSLFEELEGFDQRFFVYFEEVDFALRARGKGWRSVYLAGPRALHIGGGCSGSDPAFRLFHSLRSRLLYASKHFGPVDRMTTIVVTCVVEPVPRLFRGMIRGSLRELRDVCVAYGKIWRLLPSLILSPQRFEQCKVN